MKHSGQLGFCKGERNCAAAIVEQFTESLVPIVGTQFDNLETFRANPILAGVYLHNMP